MPALTAISSVLSLNNQPSASPGHFLHTCSKEAGLIGVEVKRKLAFKNPHLKGQLINVKKIYKAIDHLKQAGNPYYQFYDDYHTYEERCVKDDDDNLIASALHDGCDKEIMNDLSVLNINEHCDDDRLLAKNKKELLRRIAGGDKCISQCTNPAGDEECAIAIIPVDIWGHHVYWQICTCEMSTLFSKCLFDYKYVDTYL